MCIHKKSHFFYFPRVQHPLAADRENKKCQHFILKMYKQMENMKLILLLKTIQTLKETKTLTI